MTHTSHPSIITLRKINKCMKNIKSSLNHFNRHKSVKLPVPSWHPSGKREKKQEHFFQNRSAGCFQASQLSAGAGTKSRGSLPGPPLLLLPPPSPPPLLPPPPSVSPLMFSPSATRSSSSWISCLQPREAEASAPTVLAGGARALLGSFGAGGPGEGCRG